MNRFQSSNNPDEQRRAEMLTALFQTEALTVSPADQPFWYTSGKFGPYYINTHYLYGGRRAANRLLEQIEILSENPLIMPAELSDLTREQYQTNAVYRKVADYLCQVAKTCQFDFISGGARRDFFFSYIVADLLNTPHLTILKDGQTFFSPQPGEEAHELRINELNGLRALHIADLVTEASSYIRAWLPAIARCGAVISDTLAVVDRVQGGREVLADTDVKLHSLIEIDQHFFRQARELQLIDAAQEEQIRLFSLDPDDYIRSFLRAHPDFLAREEVRDERTRERVARCRSLGFGS